MLNASDNEVILNVTDCEGRPSKFTWPQNYVAGSAAGVISITGASLNLITILALMGFTRTRAQITTPFIISLATADFVFSSVTLMFLSIKFFHG